MFVSSKVGSFPVSSSAGRALAALIKELGDFELGCISGTLCVMKGKRTWIINPNGTTTRLDLEC